MGLCIYRDNKDWNTFWSNMYIQLMYNMIDFQSYEVTVFWRLACHASHPIAVTNKGFAM